MKKEMKYLCIVMITMLLAVGVTRCNRGNSQDEIDNTVQKYAPDRSKHRLNRTW